MGCSFLFATVFGEEGRLQVSDGWRRIFWGDITGVGSAVVPNPTSDVKLSDMGHPALRW
jgi:hypothetical protein